MWIRLFPNECEFCGGKKIKRKSPIGTFIYALSVA